MSERCICMDAIDQAFTNGHRPDISAMRDGPAFRFQCRYCGESLWSYLLSDDGHMVGGLAHRVRCWPWWRKLWHDWWR